MSTQRYSEAFMLIAKLASALGIQSIKDLPGPWEHRVDEKFKIRLNGHAEEVDGIPPYNALIDYEGWPWAILSPVDGHLMNHMGATEDRFCDALLAAIAKVGAPA